MKPLQPGRRFTLHMSTVGGTIVRHNPRKSPGGHQLNEYTVIFDDGEFFEHWSAGSISPENGLWFRLMKLIGRRPVPNVMEELAR